MISDIVLKYLEGMTLREFADELGVSHGTVINWRNGNTEPDADFLLKTYYGTNGWRKQFSKECLGSRYPLLIERNILGE